MNQPQGRDATDTLTALTPLTACRNCRPRPIARRTKGGRAEGMLASTCLLFCQRWPTARRTTQLTLASEIVPVPPPPGTEAREADGEQRQKGGFGNRTEVAPDFSP